MGEGINHKAKCNPYAAACNARNFSIGTGTVAGFDVEDANIALLLVASRIGQMIPIRPARACPQAVPTVFPPEMACRRRSNESKPRRLRSRSSLATGSSDSGLESAERIQ